MSDTITLEPDDEELVADFAGMRERAREVSEHFDNDDLFVKMLTYAGYRELLDLMDDHTDDDTDDGDEDIRGFY